MSDPNNRWRVSPNREFRRRLARYQLSDRLFREKYGVTLEEFETAETVKARGYSFDIENDHQDWDLAVDGIRTVERQLAFLIPIMQYH